MLNPWDTTTTALEWGIQFPARHPIDEILTWQRQVLIAGAHHQVFHVDAVPALDYRVDRDGFIVDFLDTHPERRLDSPGLIAGTLFNDGIEIECSTLLAVDINNYRVGEILASCMHPLTAFPSVFDERSDTYTRPLAVQGIVHTPVRADEYVYDLSIVPSSTIWYPWTPAPPDLLWGFDLLDNRRLAARHTARLNQFVRDVMAATEAAGGTWCGVESQVGWVDFQLDEDGTLRLDVDHLFDTAWDGPCGLTVIEALSNGIRRFTDSPLAPPRKAMIRITADLNDPLADATTDELITAVVTSPVLQGYDWSQPDAVAKVQIVNRRGDHLLGRRRLSYAQRQSIIGHGTTISDD